MFKPNIGDFGAYFTGIRVLVVTGSLKTKVPRGKYGSPANDDSGQPNSEGGFSGSVGINRGSDSVEN